MTDDDLGPLPTYAYEKQLEERSVKLLAVLLPESMFVPRDLRSTDFGIDGSLEVVERGHPTGCFFPFQLKARSGLAVDDDGGRSLRIEAKNVNYLLNSEASIVILYDADRSAFLWVPVLDEFRRLTASGVDVLAQAGVTFRLARPLRDATLSELHGFLSENRRTRRQLREQIASLAPGALVHVDSTGTGTTDDDVKRGFYDRAWMLASEGQVREVERLFGLLPALAQDEPRARFLLAYAHYCAGQPLATAGQVAEAARRGDELADDERDLLALLRVQSAFYLGRLSKAELLDTERSIESRAAPATRIQLAVQKLRHDFADAREPKALTALLAKASAVTTEAVRLLGPRHPATLSAQLFRLSLSGQALVFQYIQFALAMAHDDGGVGRFLRGGRSRVDAVLAISEKLGDWFREVGVLTGACDRWKSLLLEANHARLLVAVCVLRNQALVAATEGASEDASPDRDRAVAERIADLDDSCATASRLRMDDAEARTRLLLLDALDVARDHARRAREAEALAAFCDLHGFVQYRATAAAHLEGRSSLRTYLAEIAAQKARLDDGGGPDLSSPDERERVAAAMHEYVGLPLERLPVVRDVIESLGVVQELQRTWCRHLEIMEDETHSRSPATFYAKAPERGCACTPTGNETAIRSTDWRAVIEAFRTTYCAACPERSPRGSR